MRTYYIHCILLSLIISKIFALSVDNVKEKFGNNICIRGYIITSDKSTDIITHGNSDETEQYHSLVEVISDKESKSTLSKLHELADFNGIEYKYILNKEEGPAHNKIFTVTLTLGNEQFEGTGKSLKEAQRLAAAKALKTSVLDQPKSTNSVDQLTPTVLLNNAATKLGLPVKYQFVDVLVPRITDQTDVKSKKSYIQKLNESINDQVKIKQSIDVPEKGPFNVEVIVGNDNYFGSGYTKQEAKHNAASNALEGLRKKAMDKQSACYTDPLGAKCKQLKDSQKNAVSLIYEAANIRQLDVSFEVISESGEAHKKEFTVECRLGDFVTHGIGKSKKESKKIAAENMLTNIPFLPAISLEKQLNTLKKKKSKSKRKKNVIKSNGKESSLFVGVIDSLFGSSESVHKPVKSDVDTNTDDKSKSNNLDSKSSQVKSAQSDLLELSNKKKFEINFMDLDGKGDTYFTLLSLEINPTYLCLGEGINPKSSREVVSNHGLKLLHKLGFLDDYKVPLIDVVDEGECPDESMSIILDSNKINTE